MKIFSSKYSMQETEKSRPARQEGTTGDAAAQMNTASASPRPAAEAPDAPKPKTARPTASSSLKPLSAAPAAKADAPAKPAPKPAARPQTAAPRAQTVRPAAPAKRPAPMTDADRQHAAAATSTKAVRSTVSKAAAEQTGKTMAESAALRREAQRRRQMEQQRQPEEPRVRAGFIETVEEPTPEPVRRKTKKRRKKKKHTRRRVSAGRRVVRFAVTILVLAALYLTAVFSNIPFIAKWRTIYIQTAMATMRHQWLATYFIPHSVIDEVMTALEDSRQSQVGVNSQWNMSTEDEGEHRNPTLTNTTGMSKAEIEFFDTFWEIDVDSMLDYVHKHSEVLNDGWSKIDINEASLDSNGTTIRTHQGEQVLAIDAYQGVLIVRESGSGYRGVLAVAKDPSRLSLQAASTIGSIGQVAGEIAEEHNGIIAMTGSGFLDEGGVGNGGSIVGWAMCNGVAYGEHAQQGYKRLELHRDNFIYIKDVWDEVDPETTDAVEFSPAMIIDGEIVVDDTSGWTDLQPRACIGQSQYGEILMLLIEGRLPTVSLGLSVPNCAEILYDHRCAQAMNLDGGTSAMIWYKGDYIMKSSNPVLQAGRTLPNAFVYAREK